MNIQTLWNEGGPSGIGFSEIEAYLRCPKEYQYAAVRKILPGATHTPDYFTIGTMMHAGRARWFAERFGNSPATWAEVEGDMLKAAKALELPVTGQAVLNQALGYMREYIDHWDLRERPKPVAVEHLLGPTRLDGDDTERTARLDDFGFYPEAGGQLAIGECKTTNGSISDVINQYTLHGQPLLQRILWSLAPQGEAMYGQVAGTVLDIIKKGSKGSPSEFARVFVPSNEKTETWFRAQLALILQQRAKVTWDSKEERRITSCTRLIGKARVPCAFRDVCTYGKAGLSNFWIHSVPAAEVSVNNVEAWE